MTYFQFFLRVSIPAFYSLPLYVFVKEVGWLGAIYELIDCVLPTYEYLVFGTDHHQKFIFIDT
ncbi:hypothetical protein GCM10027180_29850 [Microbulbifer echini]